MCDVCHQVEVLTVVLVCDLCTTVVAPWTFIWVPQQRLHGFGMTVAATSPLCSEALVG